MEARTIASIVTSLACLTVSVATAHAGQPVTIESGNVTALTNALADYTAYDTKIFLEPGVYDLRGVYANANSHLRFDSPYISGKGAQKRYLIGLGEKPGDTILLGGGETEAHRVIEATGNNYGCATISNMTITGGWTSGDGGGVSGNGVVKIYDCIISNNHATGTWAAGGGGAFKAYAERCYFADNETTSSGGRGGGLWCNTVHGLMADFSQAAVDCVFVNNRSGTYGGGVYGCPRVVGCVITNNFGNNSGGGAYSCGVLVDCTIVDNTSANGSGGGAFESTAVTNCIFRGNKVTYESGGGLYTTMANASVVGCTFEDNASAKGGAGLWAGGTQVSNCVFRNNASGSGAGGGLYVTGMVSVAKCRFEGNTSKNPGGGLWANGATVSDSYFRGNVGGSKCYDVATDSRDSHTTLERCILVGEESRSGLFFENLVFRDSIVSNYFSTSDNVFRTCDMYGCLIVGNKATYSGGGVPVDRGGGVTTNANCVFLRNNSYINSITDNKTIVNCLYVENTNNSLAYGYIVKNGKCYNTVFLDNSIGGTKDFRSGAYVPMVNCTYSYIVDSQLPDDGSCVGCFKMTRAQMRLLHDPAMPFAVRASSPLRNKGYEEDWILSILGDKDFYGLPRVSWGRLDIGPTESQGELPGSLMFLR